MKNTNMAQRDISKIDKVIMDNFYKLVHNQQNIRVTAASSTFKILKAQKKKTDQSQFNDNLNYCLDRLVSGLASSRALARQGYGTLLLEILNNFQVSTERLFNIAEQKFGRISKETTLDNLLAYFLLISIVLESGIHKRNKSNAQYLEKIYNHLIHLFNIKSYLNYSVSKLLTQYYELFHSYMVDSIPQHAFGSDAKLNTLELLLVTLCTKKEPIREFMSVDKNRLYEMCSILTDDKFQKRPLHPLFAEVCLMVIKHFPESFEKFYNEIIFPSFFKSNHNELAAMGLELISIVLRSTTNTEAIKVIFSQHLVRTLILSMRNKTPLNQHCRIFIESLKEIFESTKDNGLQYIILQKLTTSPGSVSFDEDSKSSSVSDLLNKSTSTVLKKYLDDIMNILNRKSNKADNVQAQQSCARQLAHIASRPQLNEDQATIMKVTKFLLVNSLFKLKDGSQLSNDSFWSEHKITKPVKQFDDKVCPSLKNAYHSTLDHLISICKSNSRSEALKELVYFSKELIEMKDLEHVISATTESFASMWKDYMVSLKKHEKFLTKQKDAKDFNPMTVLFYFYGLQILEHGLECKEQLDELEKTCLKEDGWADIVTDQLIAILSATECSAWIRKLTESIFGTLLPDISQTSIELICDAVKTPLDEGYVDSENDAVDDDDDDADSYAESSSDEEMSGEEVELGEENGVQDEAEMEVDNDENTMKKAESKSTKKNASSSEVVMNIDDDNQSDEAVDGTEESEDEEYLDDEQMMKLDSVLADMFRLNRVGKKKVEPTFQLRCLDLVKRILMKKHNDTELINSILTTIIPLAIKSKKTIETRPLSDKIVGMLKKMPGKAKYPQITEFLGKQQ